MTITKDLVSIGPLVKILQIFKEGWVIKEKMPEKNQSGNQPSLKICRILTNGPIDTKSFVIVIKKMK